MKNENSSDIGKYSLQTHAPSARFIRQLLDNNASNTKQFPLNYGGLTFQLNFKVWCVEEGPRHPCVILGDKRDILRLSTCRLGISCIY
jgi:hypothetical protein